MIFSLLYIPIIFLYFLKVTCLTVNLYEIRDLEETTGYFETESQTWQLFSAAQSYKSTSCGTSAYLLGGYQVIGPGGIFTRTYYSLPAHNTVSFSVIFWILDLDKTANLFEIFIDNQYLGVWDSTLYDAYGANFQTNYCGENIPDFPNSNIRGKIPHSSSQITIKIIFSAQTDDHFSFGFRNLSLLFSTSSSAVTASSCKFVMPPASQATCGCQDGYYNPVGSGSCLPCDSTCASCSGGTANDCNSCKLGYSFDGTKCIKCNAACSQCSGTAANQCVRCANSAYFLQVDGTCSSACSSPYVAKTIGSYKVCDYPCGATGFVNDNSTCSTSCPYPYEQETVSGIKYCHLPCAVNQYLFKDNNCKSNCPGSFVEGTDGYIKYCTAACSSTQFYNPNSTCTSSCPSPYIEAASGGTKYCSAPCSSPNFTYKNGSCLASCLYPYVQTADGFINYCNLPCSSGQFFTENANCTTSCPDPYVQVVINGVKYCNRPCGANFLYQNNNTCSATCFAPYVQTTDGYVKYCGPPCLAATPFLNDNNNCTGSCPAPYIESANNGVNYCSRPCGSGFLYQNNTCDSSCVAPYTQTTDGYLKYCISPCSSGLFLNDNNNCTASCPAPYIESTSNGVKYCSRPCGSGFLYQNNTCGTTCVAPYTQTTDGYMRYCISPCSSGLFLNDNNNCTGNCPSSYVQSTSNGVQYCNRPCGGNFLYQNSSCGTTCVAPYVQANDGYIKYCISPCPSGLFLNQNNNCTTSCPTPYVQSSSNGVQYCDRPCGTNFLYQNNTCGVTCVAPFTQATDGYIQYCISPCPSSQFLNQNNSCTTSCPSPYIQSSSNGVQYCQTPCGTGFLYRNNTCSLTCAPPYTQATDGFVKYCNPPCSNSQFYYDDGTCRSTCPSSYLQRPSGDITYCNPPCDPSKFIYENGSCLSTCASPFKQRPSGGLQYCNKPCSGSLFLYPNGSCLSQCDYDDVTDSNQIRHCQYPCSSSQYYYEDTTCKNNCPIPYIIKIVDQGLNLCNSPCNSSSLYYSEYQKKCIESCSSPYNSKSDGYLKICQDTPSDEDDETTLSDMADTVSSIGDVLQKAGSLFRSGKNSIFMVSLAKMIRYVIYMNITLPERVKESFESSNSSFFSISMMFSFNMPSSWSSAFPQYPLPYIFANNKLSSSYLVNQWTSISSFVIIFTIGVVSGLMERIAKGKNWKALNMVFTRLRIMTQWAFVLFLLFNSYDDVTLYLIVQLYGLQFHSYLDYISFVVCLVVTVTAFFIFGKAVYIVYKAQKMKNQITDLKSAKTPEVVFYNRWHKFQVLYAGFKPKSFFMQVYLMISTSRIIIYYLIVAFIYKYPIFQGSLLILISIFMLGFLLYKRPVKDIVNYIVMITYETLILLVNICVIIIATLDSYDDYEDPKKANMLDVVSNLLIILNASIDICSNAFMYVYLLWNSWSFYKICKANPGLESKLVWLTLIIVPYQNPGMDFDDFCWKPSAYERRPSVILRKIYPMGIAVKNSSSSSLQILNRRFSNSSQNANDPTTLNDGSNLTNYEPSKRSPGSKPMRRLSYLGSQNFLDLDSDYQDCKEKGVCSPLGSEAHTMDTPKSLAQAFLFSKNIDGSPSSRARGLRRPGHFRPSMIRRTQIPIMTSKPENFIIIEEPSPLMKNPSETRRQKKAMTANPEQEQSSLSVKNNRFMDYSQPVYARKNTLSGGSERRKTLRILNSHVINMEDLGESDSPSSGESSRKEQLLKKIYQRSSFRQSRGHVVVNSCSLKKDPRENNKDSKSPPMNSNESPIRHWETSTNLNGGDTRREKEDGGDWEKNPREGFLRRKKRTQSSIKGIFFPN